MVISFKLEQLNVSVLSLASYVKLYEICRKRTRSLIVETNAWLQELLLENRVMKFPHCTDEKKASFTWQRENFSRRGERAEGRGGGGLSIGETTRASFSVETFDSVRWEASEDATKLSSPTLIPHPSPSFSTAVLRCGGKYLS